MFRGHIGRLLAVLLLAGLFVLCTRAAESQGGGDLEDKPLIDCKGNRGSTDYLKNKAYVLVYVSRHTCPACVQFTPILKRFHEEYCKGDRFAILFLSEDRTEEKMLAYMSEMKMPWPGVAKGTELEKKLKTICEGVGVPRLFLLDSHGNVHSKGYEGRRRLKRKIGRSRFEGRYKVLADLVEIFHGRDKVLQMYGKILSDD
jgi:thioredoxin-related protein